MVIHKSFWYTSCCYWLGKYNRKKIRSICTKVITGSLNASMDTTLFTTQRETISAIIKTIWNTIMVQSDSPLNANCHSTVCLTVVNNSQIGLRSSVGIILTIEIGSTTRSWMISKSTADRDADTPSRSGTSFSLPAHLLNEVQQSRCFS